MSSVSSLWSYDFVVPLILIVVISPMIDIVDVPAVITSEIIKTMILRMKLWIVLRVPQMPFADDARIVVRFFE